MKRLLLPLAFILAAAALVGVPFPPARSAPAAARIVHHDLRVRLSMDEGTLAVEDEMRIARPAGGEDRLSFTLHSGLAVRSVECNGAPVAVPPTKSSDDGWKATWTIELPASPGAASGVAAESPPPTNGRVRIVYDGKIADAVRPGGDLSFVVGDDTRGVICAKGAYLSDGSCWIPADGGLATFDLATTASPGFEIVTQGTRTAPTKPGDPTLWKGRRPADGIALVAGPWTATSRTVRTASGPVEVTSYLTARNAEGAKTLLDAAESYLPRYVELLGPYPFDRFDIVENWFTTGFGMPEFTLLGGDVIARMLAEAKRKGAIPPGYLDHEIVHCWWGNGVYPDYETGNWCEALTTYCANYMAKEWASPREAAEHRRTTSLRFALRVTPANDYPVRRFRGKAEAADDDIGYGKGSMFFHQLRRELGDAEFWGALRRLAAERVGQRASWDDFRRAFEKASGRNLEATFAQALDRTGAPLLELADAKFAGDSGSRRVSGVLRQRLAPGEEPRRLAVPVVVEHVDGIEERMVDVTGAETAFSIEVPSTPLRIAVDPENHVFRTLAADEIPPCLAATLARPNVLVVHPDGDDALAAVAKMAARREGVRIVSAAAAPSTLPAGTSVLILGDESRVPLLGTLRAKLPRHFPTAASSAATTLLCSSRSPADPAEFVTTFTGKPEALASRSRAVYYYQFDGRIVFDGPAPVSRTQSPSLSRTASLVVPALKIPTSAERVSALVARLASPELNGRLAGSADESKARKIVADELRLCGIEPEIQPFSFVVKGLANADTPALVADGAAVAGSFPLTASAATPEGGVHAAGVVGEEDPDPAGRAMVVDLGPGSERPITFLRGAAALAKARGAVALLVRVPAESSSKLAELWEFPETLHPDVAKRLAQAKERGGHGDPWMRAAGTAVRTGSDEDLPLPAVIVPAGFVSRRDQPLVVRCEFAVRTIASANLVARIPARSPRLTPGTVLLGAHVDHLGPGFPGADDNASGIAALVEATQVLSAQPESLARNVTIVVFGAEEWGLRGARAFVAALPERHGIASAVTADTVGRAGIEDVSIVGISKHPKVARVVQAALERSGLAIGRDIDERAFAWGSDHYALHERGIPVVDLWSGDYMAMHTAGDTADRVDSAKTARIGSALALSAILLAAGN